MNCWSHNTTKRRPLSCLAILLLVPTLLSQAKLVSQAQQHSEPQCSVEILSPRPGGQVAESSLVKGKANIPSGKDLWVFVHVKGLALWWPQGAGPASIEDGKWEVLAYWGAPQDSGRDFDVLAAVLEPAVSNRLLDWVKKGDETGTYPGMRFPAVVHSCPITRITVTKVH